MHLLVCSRFCSELWRRDDIHAGSYGTGAIRSIRLTVGFAPSSAFNVRINIHISPNCDLEASGELIFNVNVGPKGTRAEE